MYVFVQILLQLGDSFYVGLVIALANIQWLYIVGLMTDSESLLYM